jgi:hypothetical protein
LTHHTMMPRNVTNNAMPMSPVMRIMIMALCPSCGASDRPWPARSPFGYGRVRRG